jgi:hypothetical protein
MNTRRLGFSDCSILDKPKNLNQPEKSRAHGPIRTKKTVKEGGDFRVFGHPECSQDAKQIRDVRLVFQEKDPGNRVCAYTLIVRAKIALIYYYQHLGLLTYNV